MEENLVRVNGYMVQEVDSYEEMKELVLSIDRLVTGRHEIYEGYLLDDELYHVNVDSEGQIYFSVEAVDYDEIIPGVTHYTLFPI